MVNPTAETVMLFMMITIKPGIYQYFLKGVGFGARFSL